MTRTILGIASLTLLWTLCGQASAQARAPAPPKGAWKEPIIGRGETEETAKRDAAQKAAEVVSRVMQQVNPPVRFFKVDEEFVQKYLLAGAGEVGDDFQVENIAKPFKQWTVTLRPYRDWWQDLLNQDRAAEVAFRMHERQVESERRQNLTARVMLGLSLLLLVGVGYVRLDERTQRRYTAWLRVAGAGAAATMAAGWWWMFVRA